VHREYASALLLFFSHVGVLETPLLDEAIFNVVEELVVGDPHNDVAAFGVYPYAIGRLHAA